MKNTKKPWLDSFTKFIVIILLVNAMAWVWCSYGLAFLGRYEIAESLSETAITTILGTVIAYCTKSAVENVNKYGINLRPTYMPAAKSNLKRDY